MTDSMMHLRALVESAPEKQMIRGIICPASP